MISYEPFWCTLILNDITTYTLIKKHHISSSTINRLRHNQDVSTATINKLCEILNCDVYDIVRFVSEKKN